MSDSLTRKRVVDLQDFLSHDPDAIAALLDAVPEYVWVSLDKNLKTVLGNRAANEMTGVGGCVNVSQTPPKGVEAVRIRMLKEDGSEYAPEELPMQRSVALQKPVRDVYLNFVLPDGRNVLTVGSATPLFDAKGELRGSVAVFVDITGRKKAEEALRQSEQRFKVALDESPVTVFSQDRHLRYTWAYNPSPGFKIEAFLGKRDDDLYAPEDATVFTAIKRRVMATGVGSRDEVVTHRPVSAGGDMIHEMTTEPLRDGKGKIVGVICSATDITARKQLEDQLKETNEELESKVKARTARLRTLAAELTQAEHKERRRIAHMLHEDLQQRLAAIAYKVHDLKDSVQGVSALRMADRTLHELAEAIELTRTLTTRLAPPVLYLLGLRPALETLAKEMKTQSSLSVTVTGIQTFRLPSDAMRGFAFDAVRELLLNVAKHSGVKSAEVRIRPAGRKRIVVEVRDKGKGIARNAAASERFGLFSIRERAEAMGIGFDISSRPGKGTCVALSMPIL